MPIASKAHRHEVVLLIWAEPSRLNVRALTWATEVLPPAFMAVVLYVATPRSKRTTHRTSCCVWLHSCSRILCCSRVKAAALDVARDGRIASDPTGSAPAAAVPPVATPTAVALNAAPAMALSAHHLWPAFLAPTARCGSDCCSSASGCSDVCAPASNRKCWNIGRLRTCSSSAAVEHSPLSLKLSRSLLPTRPVPTATIQEARL